MKKIKNVIMIIVILMCVSNVSFAHGGNITGWKDKDSKNITEYNGKYYGYHKENGKKHYHQVKWDEENQKWVIVMPAVGINTKETVDPEIGEEAWGKEASNFTKEKLENATKIELEFDNQADEKDQYKRYLAWIWVDDELLQNLLVQNGLAATYMLQNNYKYAGMLQESEEVAKNNKIGIWSDETSNIQNNKNENQIIENNNIENDNFLYVIMGFIIILIISIFNIAYNKKKRK